MKVLIVSDSHGHNEYLDDLIREYQDVDLFLHAGDSEVPPHTIYPFRVVKGNCDYIYDMPEELIIPSPFGNILLRHKDNAPIKFIKENNIRIYIFGHTHVKTCIKKNDIVYINPGSLTFPRDDSTSYAILENDEKYCYLSFIDALTKRMVKRFRIYEYKDRELAKENDEIKVIEKVVDGNESLPKEDIMIIEEKEPANLTKEEIKEIATEAAKEIIEANLKKDDLEGEY